MDLCCYYNSFGLNCQPFKVMSLTHFGYIILVGGNYMEILERIDELRKERGWSINYLAMESELTQSTLNNLYSRKTEPKISTLRSICNAFGITLADFFKEDEPDDELIRKIKSMSAENKKALLILLKNVK